MDAAAYAHWLFHHAESPHLQRLLAFQQTRLDYADHLRALGEEERARFLELMNAQIGAYDPTRAKALQALRETLDEEWVRLVTYRAEVRNCGKIDAQAKARFLKVCDEAWTNLDESGDARVRNCRACDKEVYLCESLPEVALRAKRGECVAVSGDLVSKAHDEMTRGYMGQPDGNALWAEAIFDE